MLFPPIDADMTLLDHTAHAQHQVVVIVGRFTTGLFRLAREVAAGGRLRPLYLQRSEFTPLPSSVERQFGRRYAYYSCSRPEPPTRNFAAALDRYAGEAAKYRHRGLTGELRVASAQPHQANPSGTAGAQLQQCPLLVFRYNNTVPCFYKTVAASWYLLD